MVVDALHVSMWAQSDPKKRGTQPEPLLAGLMGMAPQTRSRMTPQERLERLKAQAEAHNEPEV